MERQKREREKRVTKSKRKGKQIRKLQNKVKRTGKRPAGEVKHRK